MLEFPENWVVRGDIQRWIDTSIDWAVVTWDPIFSAINIGVLAIQVPLEKFLLWLPWWFVIGVVGLLAWRVVGRNIAAVAMALLFLMGVLGLLDYAMQTLAILITATLLAVGIGMPLGILGAKSDRLDAIIRPILDGMQTMPSFVYLVPAIMLFGLGKTPAIMATLIYAVPPLIRLTNLGIRQVDPEVVEAARAFGSTSRQILVKVQLPMAVPTIMAGINQTIMMALAMVVIASMIGAKGLGIEVLNGIARLEVGRGFLGGLGIVFMAIIIDRITQGLARGRRARST
jgi:glycine betaine/proline transport system permease protein